MKLQIAINKIEIVIGKRKLINFFIGRHDLLLGLLI